MSIFSGTGSGSASDVNVVTAPSTLTTPLSNLDAEVGAVNSPAASSDAANDSNVIGFIKRLLGKLPSALQSDRLKVDGSGVTQPISGSVSVSNLPATQPISGSVSVSNLPATQPISAASLPLPDTIVAEGTLFSYGGTGSYGTFDCGANADYVILHLSGGGGGFTHNIEASPNSTFSPVESTSSVISVFNERMGTVYLDTSALRFGSSLLNSGSTGTYVISLYRTNSSEPKHRWVRVTVSGGGGGSWTGKFTAFRSNFKGNFSNFQSMPAHRILTHSLVDINSCLRELPVIVAGTAQVSDRGSTGPSTISSFTSTSSNALALANANRKLLTIYNEGPANLHVLYGGGTASTTNYSVRLSANDYIEINRYVGQINAIFAASGSTARITEIT